MQQWYQCPRCGSPVAFGVRFCGNCGTELNWPMQQTQPIHKGAETEVTRHRELEGFKSLNKRATSIYWIFIIMLIISIVAFWSDYAEAQLIQRVIAGETITEFEAMANDSRQATIAFAWSILYFASAVAFLMWMHRAHKNLSALGATGLRFTPGWAVGWFFVPIMCLFRPYQVTSEIWKASEPKVDTTDSTSWKNVATSPIVGWWWAFFLISSYIAMFAARLAFTGEELSQLLASTYSYMASEIIDVIGIPITILMVRRISQLQELKGKLISRAFC